MAAKTSFRGSFTALVTPFRNGSVDEKAFRGIVDWQIAEGTNGLVPVGTTGESPTLSHDEHKQVVEWCVEQVDGRVPVVAGAGSNSTKEAIELAQHAEKAGADAVLVVTPYYNKPTQEGMYQHFKAINDAIGIPIIIYNIPPRSVIDMSVDTMKRLFELKNIAGVKDATANMARTSQQRAALGPDFNQLSGEDITALGFNAHGGHGCISVTSNVAPAPVRRVPGRLPARRLRGCPQAAGQARAAAHQPVRRDEPGAGEVRHVAHRQVLRRGAPADGSRLREGAHRGSRGDGAGPGLIN
jgi:4-hydroxy-tetrahydrodipicolinate synthase